ncbi:hypothetical protein [Streptomyces minutiscleroticus]|uniref:hypothetical protein n=1 Tax=Streptomyces minutiscleroticus TaxID=68238 RepID=UPI0033293FD4
MAAIIVAGTALSACSKNETREYTPPKSLCNVSVEPDSLSPFLPGGKKISQQQESPNGGTERCKVSVDGKIAVIAGQVWWNSEGNVTEVASAHAKISPGQVTDDEQYFYSGTGAVGKAQGCTDKAHPDQSLFTALQVFAEDHDNKDAMKQLITEYTEQVRKDKKCM